MDRSTRTALKPRVLLAAVATALLASSAERLARLLEDGVTTVEIKSGYGLDVDAEAKMLRAARALGTSEKVRVSPTLLALHALPPEFRDRREDYVRLAIESILPAVASEDLATAVDAYCEGIGFAPDEVRYERKRPPPRAVLDQLGKLGHAFSKKRIPIGDAGTAGGQDAAYNQGG